MGRLRSQGLCPGPLSRGGYFCVGATPGSRGCRGVSETGVPLPVAASGHGALVLGCGAEEDFALGHEQWPAWTQTVDQRGELKRRMVLQDVGGVLSPSLDVVGAGGHGNYVVLGRRDCCCNKGQERIKAEDWQRTQCKSKGLSDRTRGMGKDGISRLLRAKR
ncbi:hypothetical protein L7F22_045951 [Adiantum nelumboides]|nr:hypothetical protein [Adiantum nelumboides]